MASKQLRTNSDSDSESGFLSFCQLRVRSSLHMTPLGDPKLMHLRFVFSDLGNLSVTCHAKSCISMFFWPWGHTRKQTIYVCNASLRERDYSDLSANRSEVQKITVKHKALSFCINAPRVSLLKADYIKKHISFPIRAWNSEISSCILKVEHRRLPTHFLMQKIKSIRFARKFR